MTTKTTNENIIERSYIDNAAIKEFTTDTLIPKYFSDVDASTRTVGMIGMTTELISNIAEDGFNATSVLFREIFPNRAEIPESIYSHAAIFQLSDIFANPSSCDFIIALEEEAIINNMVLDKDKGIYYFYINKDLTVYVEDIPFTLDYDVRIRCVRKKTDKGYEYIFAASYDMGDYSNSISNINNPYIPILRDYNGILAIKVTMHQIIREVEYASIITNNKINLPSVDIPFEGQLAGFEVLYKGEDDTDYSTQLIPLVVYSSPTTSPFCYYQLYDDNVLRLSFNSKDSYFIPDYNSELKVILYISQGATGNFDVYTGDNISTVSETMSQEYDVSFVVASKPLNASMGGTDRKSIESLRNLTVENYRTAKALTTEPDLEAYFSDWTERYGTSHIKFIKRRNDVYERIFGGYILMKDDDYIYRTNTLNIRMNVSDMIHPEKNSYMIEAGTLFVYDGDDKRFLRFKRDEAKYDEYYEEYRIALEEGAIPFLVDVDPDEIPDHLNRSASFAEFKRRNNYDDKLRVFDLKSSELEELDDPINNKFLFINPFLIRFRQDPNLVSLYLTTVKQNAVLDSIMQNDNSFVQFVGTQISIKRGFTKEKKYTISTVLAPTVSVSNSNPLIAIDKINEDGSVEYIFDDETKTKDNDLRVFFVIYDSTRAICYKEMYPHELVDMTRDIRFQCEIFTDNDLITSEGLLRLDKDNDSGLINMTGNDFILIPMEDVTCRIFTLYNKVYDEEESKLVKYYPEVGEISNIFVEYESSDVPDEESIVNWLCTNEYATITDPLTFIQPLNQVRSNLYFEDYLQQDEDGNFIYDIMDVRMESVPFIRWSTALDEDKFNYFINTFVNQYENIDTTVKTYLRNETAIDMKLYNTYGRSDNYFIVGDEEEPLNVLNLRIKFDMWFVSGTNVLERVPAVKRFIKEKIESINEYGLNQLHISNLMREIEMNFPEVHHIRFRGINNYDTNYQSIKLIYTDLDDMGREERRKYVPELLVCEFDDIIINDYISD